MGDNRISYRLSSNDCLMTVVFSTRAIIIWRQMFRVDLGDNSVSDIYVKNILIHSYDEYWGAISSVPGSRDPPGELSQCSRGSRLLPGVIVLCAVFS